jgi:hypothetical protein
LAVQRRLLLRARYRRSLLRRLERARRATLTHHVHRTARLGAQVLIIGRWYKLSRRLVWKPTIAFAIAGATECPAGSSENTKGMIATPQLQTECAAHLMMSRKSSSPVQPKDEPLLK